MMACHLQVCLISYHDQKSSKYNQFNQMSIHELLLSKCDLCSPENPELRILLRQLKRKIAALLTRFPHPLQERTAGEMEGFQQLLRVMGLGQAQQGRGPFPCKHQRLFKMLLKSLNCNWDTLDYLCDLTAAKVAERYYILSLLETQMKNAADRVATEDVEVPLVKEEEVKFASLRTLPSEKDIGSGLAPINSQTSLEEQPMDLMPAFPFYCHFPIYFGSH